MKCRDLHHLLLGTLVEWCSLTHYSFTLEVGGSCVSMILGHVVPNSLLGTSLISVGKVLGSIGNKYI